MTFSPTAISAPQRFATDWKRVGASGCVLLLSVVALVSVVSTAQVQLWFGLAQILSAHAARLPVVARLGNWLAPLVMIGVGLYILGNTATDMS